MAKIYKGRISQKHDTLRTIFGKISKWFADLGQLAFKNKISKDDLDNDL